MSNNKQATSTPTHYSKPILTTEQRISKLTGREKFFAILENRKKELEIYCKEREDLEAEMLTLAMNKTNLERRKNINKMLEENAEFIKILEDDIEITIHRLREFDVIKDQWDTPLKPLNVTQPQLVYPPLTSQIDRDKGLQVFYDNSDSGLMNPNQYQVPTNLPKYRLGNDSYQEIEEFTQEFAIVLAAHGLNMNKSWFRLLPLCINMELRNWLLRTHSAMDKWSTVCESLHRHYGNPNKQREAIVQLYKTRKYDDETIMDFIQRFIKLAIKAQIELENHLVIEYFLSQLPENFGIQLQMAIEYGKIKRSLIEMEAYIRRFPGVNDKRSRNSHNMFNHTNITQNKKEDNNRFTKKKATANKYCTKHGKGWHSTEECSYTKKSANSETKNTANTNTNTTYNKSGKIICHNCNEPGHISPKCPLKEENIKARRTWLRNQDKNLENNDLHDYEVPITINGHDITALIDTGANMSFITTELTNKLQITTKPVSGIIELAIPGFKIDRIATTEPLIIQCGEITVEAELEVVAELNGPSVFIGSDLLPKLEIPINGLPFQIAELSININHNNIDEIVPSIESNTSTESIPDELLKQAMIEIQPELVENEEISPLEICPLEMAVVRLDTPEGRFVHRRQFQIAERMKPAMDSVINEWIDKKVISRITDPTQFNTPIFPIPKKDHTGAKTLCRPCMDFRALNDLIEADKYPLPLIHDIFESLKGSNYFTSLDLESAYHRFPVLEGHQHKTAFTWNDIQYKFLRAPFGLKNLPSQFQRVINFIFQDCPFIKTFIDDAIVFSKDLKTHIIHVKIAISKLNKANLILNIPKCHFFKKSLLLLGFRVNSYGHAIDTNHICKIVDWKIPSTGKQIQSFLGFVNYFREHIPMVSKITAPLDELRSKSKIYSSDWNNNCQTSFRKLKEILFAAPILSYPDFNSPFFIGTDASAVGIGAVLYQIDKKTKKKHFISFQARSLSKSERNYSTTKRELLGIVFSLRKFHRYIWGTHFTLYTDHKALTYLHTQQNLSPMLVGWYDLIFDYDFAVFHKPGIRNILPDKLSRFYTEEEGETEPKAQSKITIRSISKQTDIINNINDDQKKQLLIKQHLLGHYGPESIVKALKALNYSWPKMNEQAIEICKSCIQCLRYNITRHGYHPLTSIEADQPFDHIAIDLAGPFNTSEDNKHWLLVVIDIHSRFVLLRTLVDKAACTVANELLNIFFNFGFPKIIQSDNGKEFVNSIIKEITTVAKIDHRLITPYHPRANGAAERTVKTAKLMIYKLIKGIKTDWSSYVPFTQYCINSKLINRTKTSPFIAMFGRSPNQLENYSEIEINTITDQQVKERINFMQKVLFPAIKEATAHVTEALKNKFNRTHPIIDIPEGTYVMITDKTRTSKSDPANEGPFKITRKTQGGSYELQDLDGQTLTRHYPPRDLLPISNNDLFEEQSYEVEKIVDHRNTDTNEIEYKVHWKGYSSKHDTWEPFNNFDSLTPIDNYWNELNLKTNPNSKRNLQTGGK
jgi:transposase InsO family protein